MSVGGAWAGFFAALLAGVLIGFFGSDGTRLAFGVPVFALCLFSAFAIQWIAFVPAWFLRTERFFDLVGSATYIGTACIALILSEELSIRALVISGLVAIWALRLGVFLTLRVRREDGDRRFNTIKYSFPTFLMTWTLQAVWVSVTFAPGLASIVADDAVRVDSFLVAGVLIWLLGFAFEVIADEQKRRFRGNPENTSRFIESGLWRWSRHPNYFGEIVLWFGIAVISYPVLEGWQYMTLISPVFVWLLLTKISGVRMLEASAKKRWGDDPEYIRYLTRTSTLIPMPPHR